MLELQNTDFLEMPSPKDPMKLPNMLKEQGNTVIIVGNKGISSEELWDMLPTIKANVIVLMDTGLYDWTLLVGLWNALRVQREMPKMVVYNGYQEGGFLVEDRYTIDYLENTRNSEAAKLVAEYYPNVKGDIIVFLSSDDDLEEMQLLLKSNSKCYREGRKIILATNKTLINSLRIGLVIDTMLDTRYKGSIGGGTSLQRSWETQASAEYRRSFLGRASPGICLRMCSELSYIQLAGRSTSPSADRVTLNLKKRHLPIFNRDGEYWNTVIDELGVNINFAEKVPLGVRNVTALEYLIKAGYEPSGAIAVLSMLDMYGPDPYILQFGKSPNETERTYLSRIKSAGKKFIGRSDIDTFANIMESLLNDVKQINDNTIITWSQEHNLDHIQMLAAWSKIKQVLKALGLSQLNVFSAKDISLPIRVALAKAYPDSIMTRKKEIYYLYEDTTEFYLDDRATNTMATLPPNRLIALIISNDSNTILVAADLEDEFERQLVSEGLRELKKPPIPLRAPAISNF